jgi:uncharacterized protein involved in outer membrane biogenesis
VHVDAKFSGAGLDAGARGSLRFVDARPRGKLDVTFAAADARLPRRDPGVAMPVAFGARVSMDGDRFYFDAVDGRIAGTKLKGQIMLAPGHPARLEGRIDADSLDAASLIALAIGSPVSVRNGASWSSEPFAPGAFADIDGQIDFSVARAAFGDGLFANRLRGTVRISPSAVMLDEIEGSLGDGRVAGRAEFRTASTGLSADARISLVNADLSAVMPRPAVGKALGRVSVRLNASGAGLSPAALVGALQGSGSITAENLQLANLDPNAIDAAALAAQRGVPVDAIRIGDIVRTALDAGKLNIPSAGGPVAIDGGRLTLGPVTALAQGADVAFTGSYDLGAEALDLKVGLTGAPRPDAPNGQRPELSVAIKGTLDAPRRSVDVAALINWLALRRVEQESKRLEAAEQDAKRVQAQAAEALRRAREAQSAEQAAPQAPAPTPPAATTTAERAPDLGPLIDIKSWLTGSTNKPRRPAPPDHPPAAAHKPAPPLAITPSGAQ